jgi:hypothetical protein
MVVKWTETMAVEAGTMEAWLAAVITVAQVAAALEGAWVVVQVGWEAVIMVGRAVEVVWVEVWVVGQEDQEEDRQVPKGI